MEQSKIYRIESVLNIVCTEQTTMNKLKSSKKPLEVTVDRKTVVCDIMANSINEALNIFNERILSLNESINESSNN